MNPDKTSEQLTNEIASLRKQIGDLEKTEKERNKMVETLRKERNFSSAVLDTVGALVIVLDRQGRVVTFNKTCEDITGYAIKEVFSKYIWDVFIIPEEIKQVKDVFAKLVGTKFPSKFENYWVTKDGSRRLISWSNSALLDDDNSVEFVIGTGIDITERREAVNSLRESEEKYRTIIEDSHDMIWTFDVHGNFTFLNQQTTVITGYKIENVQGKSFAQYIYPDDLKIAQGAFQDTMAGKPQRSSMRVYKADGTLFTMLFTLAPVYKEGKIVGGVGFGVDIGTRKLMEAALHESEKRYRTLAEAAHDMIFIVDRNFRIQYVNSFGAKQFDAQPADIIGKSLAELFPSTAERMQENIRKVFNTRQPLCISNKTPYPKKELWLETWLAPIMDSQNNKVASVMGIARDITQIKKQDEEILKSKQILETITDGISNSIFLLSRDLRIIWANNAAVVESGYSKEELIGNFCYKVNHNSKTPCLPPLDICPVSEMVRTAKPVTMIHTYFDKYGKKRQVELTSYPIKDDAGEIIQFVHIEKNIRPVK
jgi:PAS domain S-box-containing protein